MVSVPQQVHNHRTIPIIYNKGYNNNKGQFCRVYLLLYSAVFYSFFIEFYYCIDRLSLHKTHTSATPHWNRHSVVTPQQQVYRLKFSRTAPELFFCNSTFTFHVNRITEQFI